VARNLGIHESVKNGPNEEIGMDTSIEVDVTGDLCRAYQLLGAPVMKDET
jgi:hypothetical protein